MKKIFLLLVWIGFISFSCKKNKAVHLKSESPVAKVQPKEWVIDYSEPVWHDEFDEAGKPDISKWSYDMGGHGWGNQELQYYTDALQNAINEYGYLNINALKQKKGTNNYTSARLVSKNKGDFTYGRVEVKAKLPKGVGTWPAIWMLASQTTYGQTFWPDNGEIDIMEHVGFDQNVVHGNVHTKAFNHTIGTNKGNHITVPKASDKFNIYAVNWFPNRIEFEINGGKYFEFKKDSSYQWEQWPFDKKFHIILNIAVGGGWGGQKGVDDNIFPQTMQVDYVRVYGIKEK
ncbi:MAG: glycoside hydrolase family 16 protein [Cytophagaceae bacterium]|nr:glycoside hydrolase family 16 protein [Cytophagaceae bacterium]MBL0303006.1 glycoside hydrolase family 16 protein [Cytophagaceae bacterium]MBL0325837.1 glycoside hydrolase family 16 protein [Cytophagaceae bacterium]